MEIFREIFEDFWILFGALIRAVRVVGAVRVLKARIGRLVRVIKATIVVRVVKIFRKQPYIK